MGTKCVEKEDGEDYNGDRKGTMKDYRCLFTFCILSQLFCDDCSVTKRTRPSGPHIVTGYYQNGEKPKAKGYHAKVQISTNNRKTKKSTLTQKPGLMDFRQFHKIKSLFFRIGQKK